MDSTMENQNADSVPQSVAAAWQRCKEILAAGSFSEAWNSFKQMVEVMPVWALVLTIVIGLTLVTNAWIVPALMIGGGVVIGTFYTVKYAVREALREHDSRNRL